MSILCVLVNYKENTEIGLQKLEVKWKERLMISIENLNKQFKNQLVLNNINVKFSNGHIYGIIGRNGSGKTVLLYLWIFKANNRRNF